MTFEQMLDTGTFSDANFLPGDPTGVDVLISYNADPVEHAVVFPAGDTVEIVFVANFLCINLIPAAVVGIIFTSEPMGQTASTTTSRVVERSNQDLLFEFGVRSNPA